MSKKNEFYERQEERKPDRPETKDGFPFTNKELYDNLPLTKCLFKSGRTREDHPELPLDVEEVKILAKEARLPVELLLRTRLVGETLKTKEYDVEKVEKGIRVVETALMRLLQKLETN